MTLPNAILHSSLFQVTGTVPVSEMAEFTNTGEVNPFCHDPLTVAAELFVPSHRVTPSMPILIDMPLAGTFSVAATGAPHANSADHVPLVVTLASQPNPVQLSNLGMVERVTLIGPVAFLFPGSAGIAAAPAS
jgi:hypothetical protein